MSVMAATSLRSILWECRRIANSSDCYPTTNFSARQLLQIAKGRTCTKNCRAKSPDGVVATNCDVYYSTESVVLVPQARNLITADSWQHPVVPGEVHLVSVADRSPAILHFEVTFPAVEERVIVEYLLRLGKARRSAEFDIVTLVVDIAFVFSSLDSGEGLVRIVVARHGTGCPSPSRR